MKFLYESEKYCLEVEEVEVAGLLSRPSPLRSPLIFLEENSVG